MRTQQDTSVRMVALSNLKAMCERVSGSMCHHFTVSRVTANRVHVTYSNEDEYAVEHPMTAVFPCYPSAWLEDKDNPRVVLDILRVLHDNWHGEGWQAFSILLDCPTLWHDGTEKDWQSHREIRAAGNDNRQGLPDTCTVCDLTDNK